MAFTQTSAETRDRGQTELLGVVLLVGMTVTGMTVIVGFGAQSLQDSQTESQIQRAEHALTQFDSRASLVALGAASSQEFHGNFEEEESDFYVDESAGWMNVSILNETTDEVDDVIMNVTLGAVIYETGETTVAFQGGGVWRQTDGGTVMVSPPEYHFQTTAKEPTLTLPVVLVRGDRSLDSDVSISKDGDVVSKYPVEDDSTRSNPFDGGIVHITVHSDYYRAWGQFMENRADGTVSYDHDEETVTASLVSSAGQFTIQNGLFLTNGDSSINHFHARDGKSGVDEYNSSVGPYPSSRTGLGEVRSEGSVEIQDGRFNASTVISGSGEVRLEGGGWTPGNLSYGGWLNNKSSMDFHVRGWVRKDAIVPRADGLGSFVEDKRETFRQDHDNSQDSDIVFENGAWKFADGNSWTLKRGDYFINGTDVDWNTGDEKLTIDLSEGDVEIVVTSEWKLDKGAQIEVINPDGGDAKIYLAADDKPKFEVLKGSSVTIAGDKADALWVYGRRGKQTEFMINDGSSFTGVLYAPGRESVRTKGHITGDSELFGAVVATEIKLESNSTIHFDSELSGSDPTSGDYTSEITFLHVSVNTIRVES